MKIRFSDIDLMLDIIMDYQNHFSREDNEEWYDEVEALRCRLEKIWLSKNKNKKL